MKYYDSWLCHRIQFCGKLTGIFLPLTLPLCSPLTHTVNTTDYQGFFLGKGELVMNTSSILMAWERVGRCQAPVKRNMDFHFKQAMVRMRGAGGVGVQTGQAGPIPGRGWCSQWCSTCLLWVTVIEIHLRTSIAVSASQASWQVADLQSCSMIHIGVRAGEHEQIHKKYLALSLCGRAGSVNELHTVWN